MKGTKKRRKNPNPYSKGEMNRIIDGLVHPFFKTGKGFILIDGILHGLVEQNPPLSVKKFIKYNLTELTKPMKIKLGSQRGRKRRYNCKLPVNNRYMFCNYSKAGSWCLKVGAFKTKCPRLIISYKKVRT
jgi:hypothetical protein